MLTDMFYYNQYKPFIKGGKAFIPLRYKDSDFANSGLRYFLNKSLSDSVRSYMFEFACNFNSLKNISSDIYAKKSYSLTQTNIKEFTSRYNNFIGFLEENFTNSSSFISLFKKTLNLIKKNSPILKKIGLSITAEGFLNTKNIDISTLNNSIKSSIFSFFGNMYENICSFMDKPMINHMNFKDFTYYFNYISAYNPNKSFMVIDNGVLVDISL